jgi:DnaK suppressor protein
VPSDLSDQTAGDLSDEAPSTLSVADRRVLLDRITAERDRVAVRAAELADAFDAIASAAALAPPDDEHDPEGATVGFERAQTAALLDRARGQLVELDRAAARLRDDTAGACAGCGRPIGVARLQARPTATRCVACAATRRDA